MRVAAMARGFGDEVVEGLGWVEGEGEGEGEVGFVLDIMFVVGLSFPGDLMYVDFWNSVCVLLLLMMITT